MIKTFSLDLGYSKCVYVYSWNRVIAGNYYSIFARLDWSKIVQIVFFFYRISNSAQAYMTCKVLCFASSINGKTLTMFQRLFKCCVCESLMRSRGVYLYTHLGLSRSRLISRTWWFLQLLFQEFKESTNGSTCGCCGSRKVVYGLRVVTVMVVSFLHKIVIGC